MLSVLDNVGGATFFPLRVFESSFEVAVRTSTTSGVMPARACLGVGSCVRVYVGVCGCMYVGVCMRVCSACLYEAVQWGGQ